LAIFVPVLLVALLFFNYSFSSIPQIKESPDVFLGVDVAYADLPAIKKLIDKISSYTNVFVIGSTGITSESEKLDETCQYLYDKGLDFIVYTENDYYKQLQNQWNEEARERWNSHFLGYYLFDEPGGKQLDQDRYWQLVEDAENFTDAAKQFEITYRMILNFYNYTESTNATLFTSDYALYWFDYKAGYDVMFAEFGWNYSRQLNVALNRGAATMLNKDWGVMIAWTYNHPPYVESGKELYDDLLLAYNNGAKYILLFDSNENYTEGILEEEHFEALERFWQYAKNNPRSNAQVEERVAFVLPEGFGYGFRGPNDKIWGLWEADSLSLEISYHLGALLEQYGSNLDIIYDDDIDYDVPYNQYIIWNGTIVSNT
jgi:hypothetical protein